MLIEFDMWNNLKKKIESRDVDLNLFPSEGSVWVTSFGKNIGFEQNGAGKDFAHPVLVIRKFNNQMFWVVPLSSKQKSYDFYFNFVDPNNQQVSVILAQMKTLSIKRFDRRLYILNSDVFVSIKRKLKSFL